MMKIERIIIEGFGTNCYIIHKNGEAAVIDPGADSTIILEALQKTGATLKFIMLTHGHFDHILAVPILKEQTGAQVLIHELDADKLKNPKLSMAFNFGISHKTIIADMYIKDGDVFNVGGQEFSVLHTPGHSEGSCCFLGGDVLFSGDTLFKNTIGKYKREDKDIMKNSIRRLLELPEHITVYPGHMEKTTIEVERKTNPFASFDWEWE